MNSENLNVVIDLEQRFRQVEPLTLREIPVRIQSGRPEYSNRSGVVYNELKRRNVFRAAAAYVVASWLVAQVADILLESFGAPIWAMKAVLISIAIGFPIALVISWYFEVTTTGIKLDSNVEQAETIARQKGRTMDFMVIVLLTAVIGFLLARQPELICLADEVNSQHTQQELSMVSPTA